MAFLILLYILASNGLTVAGWCWVFAWIGFMFRLFVAIANVIVKNS